MLVQQTRPRVGRLAEARVVAGLEKLANDWQASWSAVRIAGRWHLPHSALPKFVRGPRVASGPGERGRCVGPAGGKDDEKGDKRSRNPACKNSSGEPTARSIVDFEAFVACLARAFPVISCWQVTASPQYSPSDPVRNKKRCRNRNSGSVDTGLMNASAVAGRSSSTSYFASSASITETTSFESGTTGGAKRCTMFPWRSSTNFSKFHLIGPANFGSVSLEVRNL